MNLLDVLTGPWAIQPDKLLEIQAIYAAHARGERADLPAIAARLGRPLDNSQNNRGYQLAGDVAVVPLSGVLAKKMNLFAYISGGSSTEMIGASIRAAAADPGAATAVLGSIGVVATHSTSPPPLPILTRRPPRSSPANTSAQPASTR